MRLSHFMNLVCVAIIAGYVGARVQERKDIHDLGEVLNQEIKKSSHPKGIVTPEVTFQARSDAEKVLDQMNQTISDYGHVTIADLFELVGETGSFKSNHFGWTDLKAARVKRLGFGYLLELPKPGLIH